MCRKKQFRLPRHARSVGQAKNRIGKSLSRLSSRATRLASTGGAGIRRIAALATTEDDDEGVVTSVYNAVAKFGTSLLKNALTLFTSVLTFSFTLTR